MRTLLLLSVAVFLRTPALGQVSNVTRTLSGEPLREMSYEKVEGMPYLGDGSWVIGQLVDREGHRFNGVTMRYNAHEDALEVRQDNGVIVVSRTTIGSFQFTLDYEGNKKEFVFRNGFSGVDKYDSYTNFRVIYDEDSVKLIERVKMAKIKVTPAVYGEKDYEKFVTDNRTYLFLNDQFKDIRITPKAIANAFPGSREKIRDYIKSNGLDLDKEHEVIELLDYIATLDKK